MHPAASLIVFTVLSGMGFGLLAFLGIGAVRPTGWAAFAWFGLGYGLTGAGLVASVFHLGRPARALRAFTQWRTSWLSREAVLAVAALAVMAPHAASSVFRDAPLAVFGVPAAALCLATVVATGMIYASIRAVPRWHHWTTPAAFVAAALAGGALLAGQLHLAAGLFVLLAAALAMHWQAGDWQWQRAASTPETATGLGRIGRVRLFAPPHTGASYITREMVHVVGRRHAAKLRVIALVAGALLPAALLVLLPPAPMVAAMVLAMHLVGMTAARWLFFAEAEHVVGLYYGQR